MNLIIYPNIESSISKNSYGIKQISGEIYNKLMNNPIHNKSHNVVLKEKIEKEFDIKLESTLDEINVIFMSLNIFQLEEYLKLYDEEPDNLKPISEFISTITYYQIDPNTFNIKHKYDTLISELSNFWINPTNCDYSLTDEFNTRQINNKLSKYKLSKISKLNNIDILTFYQQLPTEYMKYKFISNMLCSRIYCHLILNSDFLKISKPIFDKYKIVFKYLLGYSWITLKNEEYYNYKINDNDRIVFDINTVNLLPIYPFTFDDINLNPYACVLVDNQIINFKKNYLSMEMMKNYEKYYGVCDSKEFSNRLNLFVNSSNVPGILENIDWTCCAITGNAIIACAMKYNPLIDMYKDTLNTELSEIDLINYFDYYYKNSTIELICNKESIIDYIDVIQTFVNKFPQEKTKISNIHTGTIMLSDEIIQNQITKIRKKLSNKKINLEYVKSNYSLEQIKKYFYDKYYIPWKLEQLENITKMNKQDLELFKEYLKLVPLEDFKIINLNLNLEMNMEQNDFSKYFYFETINTNKLVCKLSENIKFKIESKGIKTFEIFKSTNTNFFSIIPEMNLGYVNAFWNGYTVKCLPSFITLMMLQLATDYKYLTSDYKYLTSEYEYNPMEIIHEYRSRGFGIILNNNEKLDMINYYDNNKWTNIFDINLKDKKTFENIFGVKKSSHNIFIQFNDDINNIEHETSSTFEECFNSMINSNNINQIDITKLCKLKAINSDGKIIPLDKQIIDIGWNLLN